MRLIAALLLVLCLGDPLAAARADEPFATEENNYPFAYAAPEARGFYPTLVAAAFQRMGVDVAMMPMPWPRAMAGAEAGQWGIADIYPTPERLSLFDFSDPMFAEEMVLYVLKGHEFPYDGPQSLQGKTIGVMRGWSYGIAFDKAVTAGLFVTAPVDKPVQNFAKLALGRLDAVAMVRQGAAGAIAEAGLEGRVAALPHPLSFNPGCIAFAKSARKTELLRRFNQTLAAMKADGSYARIVAATLGGG